MFQPVRGDHGLMADELSHGPLPLVQASNKKLRGTLSVPTGALTHQHPWVPLRCGMQHCVAELRSTARRCVP